MDKMVGQNAGWFGLVDLPCSPGRQMRHHGAKGRVFADKTARPAPVNDIDMGVYLYQPLVRFGNLARVKGAKPTKPK